MSARPYTIFLDESGHFDAAAAGRRVVAAVALPRSNVAIKPGLARDIDEALDPIPGGFHANIWNDPFRFVLHVRASGCEAVLPLELQGDVSDKKIKRLVRRSTRPALAVEQLIKDQRKKVREVARRWLEGASLTICFEHGASASDRWHAMTQACMEQSILALARLAPGDALEVEVVPAERSFPSRFDLSAVLARVSDATKAFASVHASDATPSTVLAKDSPGNQLADIVANHFGPGGASRVAVSPQAASALGHKSTLHEVRVLCGFAPNTHTAGACDDSHGETCRAVDSCIDNRSVAPHTVNLRRSMNALGPQSFRACFEGPLTLLAGIP